MSKFGELYHPAFWYAMGKTGEDIKASTKFANWYVDRVAIEGPSASDIVKAYKEWSK